jgi:tRNA-2-methylthio-N6-dimethylallyladenosine synthase
VQRVLVIRPAKKNPNQLAGQTENMRWVNFDGPTSLLNNFVDLLITEALPNSLRGRVIETRDAGHGTRKEFADSDRVSRLVSRVSAQ